jgi:hypothetical protein
LHPKKVVKNSILATLKTDEAGKQPIQGQIQMAAREKAETGYPFQQTQIEIGGVTNPRSVHFPQGGA